MRHSTGPMNAVERAYVDACKGTFVCVACWLWEQSGHAPAMFTGLCGHLEFNHMKSGNVRIGHLWGYSLGSWHHQGRVIEGFTHAQMRKQFGPSLADGSALFRDTYGDAASMLEAQDEILRGHGIAPPARPDNRRWSHAA